LRLEEAPVDRVVTAGKVLRIVDVDTTYNAAPGVYGSKVIFELAGSSVIKKLECSRDKFDRNDDISMSVPTIGEVKWLFENRIALKLAVPQEID